MSPATDARAPIPPASVAAGTHPRPHPWRTYAPVLIFALLVTLARLIYLAFLSPYELSEDEAFYWEWALRPDWSYATKGPGIAWAIWLATHLLGTTELAIRAVPALAAGLATLALGALATDVTNLAARVQPAHPDKLATDRARRAGLWAAALFNLTPAFQTTALLSTIDGPYFACWAVASWAAFRALLGRSLSAWAWLGLAIATGFLFKYTILLLPPGLLIFALLHRARLALHPRWSAGLAAAAALAALGLAPVLIWNSQHNWQTVRHLLGHAGLKGGDIAPPAPGDAQAFPLQWTIELIATQAGALLPALIALIAATTWTLRRSAAEHARPHASALLLWAAAPVLAFYLLLSLQAQAEANWPLAGYLTLIPLAALWLTSPTESRGLVRAAQRLALIAGLISLACLLRLDLLRAALQPLAPALARAVPVQRVIGGAQMAASVHARAQSLHDQTGIEPLIIVDHYGQASRIRFYLPGRPIVFAAQHRLGGRKVQHDYWPDTNLDQPDLRGRPAVLVGATYAQWRAAFQRVTPMGPLEGETKKNRESFDALGFQGIPSIATPPAPNPAP